MPRVSAFYGILIFMYWNEGDHPVAHFHAHYPVSAPPFHWTVACWLGAWRPGLLASFENGQACARMS